MGCCGSKTGETAAVTVRPRDLSVEPWFTPPAAGTGTSQAPADAESPNAPRPAAATAVDASPPTRLEEVDAELTDPADWLPPKPTLLLERSEHRRVPLEDDASEDNHVPQMGVPPEPPASPAIPTLRARTKATLRALLEATDGEWTEATIPTAEVPPLASAVVSLLQAENRRADHLGMGGLQGKRLAIRSWYEIELERERRETAID